jgi:hypothetical protein
MVTGLLSDLSTGESGDGLAVAVTSLDLRLPVEVRISGRGLWVSPPRGVMRTGFMVPHGRIRIRCGAD